MEATTADLEAARFGLGMLGADEQAELFSLLRGVRVAAGDFVEDVALGATGVDPQRS
jgi:hypothetical protein